MPSELGTRLAGARKAHRWTLRDVERQTGIHNAHLSQVETGAIGRPDPNILWELAGLYDLDFDELMHLAGHVEGRGAANPADRAFAAAFRTLKTLTPDQQREALEYLQSLRKERNAERTADQ